MPEDPASRDNSPAKRSVRWDRRPFGERGEVALRAIVGVGFIVFAALFVTMSPIRYAPGDQRGTAAYRLFVGCVALVGGSIVLLSIRYPRLRGHRRPRDDE